MMTTLKAAKQKNIELGLTTGVGEEVTEWVEYSIQVWSLGAWYDLRVTLDLAQAQVLKAKYEADHPGYKFKIVEKWCSGVAQGCQGGVPGDWVTLSCGMR